MIKKSLIIISHVSPIKGQSGQEMRVRNTLLSAMEIYNVTLLTIGNSNYKKELLEYKDIYFNDLIILPSKYNSSGILKYFYKFISILYPLLFGLKASNYLIGEVDLNPKRVKKYLKGIKYDICILEYFHAYKLKNLFKDSIFTLDTHNILWQVMKRDLNKLKGIKYLYQNFIFKRYKAKEEKIWNYFDVILAINTTEYKYIKDTVPDKKVYLMKMGVDLNNWNYLNLDLSQNKSIGFYGGLSSTHNARDAYFVGTKCLEFLHNNKSNHIKCYLIGSKPPKHILDLKSDKLEVTGFIQNVISKFELLRIMIIPWEGKYGFRSRIIEIMASGIPLITTYDAVDGMDLDEKSGIYLCMDTSQIIPKLNLLWDNIELLAINSKKARSTVEDTYSLENTYKKTLLELNNIEK